MTSQTTQENLERIEIPLSNKKNAMMLLGSLAFCAMGVWLIIDPAFFVSSRFQNPTLIFWAGIAALLFFGACAGVGIHLLIKKTPGMIIDQQGLWMNSSGMGQQMVSWSDIKGFSIDKIKNVKFLVVLLSNPEAYIDTEKNSLKRSLMKANLNLSGSPVCLSSNSLKINLKTLHKLLTERLEQIHRSAPNRS